MDKYETRKYMVKALGISDALVNYYLNKAEISHVAEAPYGKGIRAVYLYPAGTTVAVREYMQSRRERNGRKAVETISPSRMDDLESRISEVETTVIRLMKEMNGNL